MDNPKESSVIILEPFANLLMASIVKIDVAADSQAGDAFPTTPLPNKYANKPNPAPSIRYFTNRSSNLIFIFSFQIIPNNN